MDGKNLAITVSGSRSFNPDIIHGQIDYYQITITADDMDTAFTERFDGDAESAKMLGIPAGVSRTILVEAFNPNGLVIRRGEKGGIDILPGKMSHAEVVMNSVPIFTNITDKSAVSGRRLVFEVFGEPESSLEIVREEDDGAEEPVVDAATSRALVDTSDDEGLFSVTPPEYGEGAYTFTVKDTDSGESSTVNITLYEATVRPALGINSGGSVKKNGNDMILTGAGQSYHRDVEAGGDDLGNATLIDIVQGMF